MKIDIDLIRTVEDELNQSFGSVCKKYGLKVERKGGINYSIDEFSIKFRFTNADVDVDRKEFVRICSAYGLKPSHYGATFYDEEGNKCIIKGINPRARKYPILYDRNGRPFKSSSVHICNLLEKNGKR
jgi:hypothetical protein